MKNWITVVLMMISMPAMALPNEFEPIEIDNGIIVPPHEVTLWIDPQEVVFIDCKPYVKVEGTYYQIVEVFPG